MTETKTVFISYSSKDSAYVERIIQVLEEMGVTYWRAPQMIPAGSNYAREIPQAIKNCAVFLLVLSEKSQNSIWVEKEIDSAICNRKSIIPFQIDKAPLSDMFRFYLNNVQMISYAEDKKLAIEELKRQIMLYLPQKEQMQGLKIQALAENTKAEKTKTEKTKKIKRAKKQVKGLSLNRIPVKCEFCGGQLEYATVGIYKCKSCGKDNYDDFQTIRNYLAKAGATPSVIIARDTGVPRNIIDYFFKEEYLEIPKSSTIRAACVKCGAPIRTGTLCEQCKESMAGKDSDYGKGRWHSKTW